MRNSLATFFFLITFGAFAQINTFSPYSIYGIGNIVPRTGIYTMGANGISQGISGFGISNTGNPASYPANRFANFEFSLFGKLQSEHDSAGFYDDKTYNFGRMSLSFPLGSKQKAGATIGLSPYSYKGYSISKKFSDPQVYTDNYSGKGGINKVYIGAGYKILKSLSVGFNANYLFGDMIASRTTAFDTAVFTNYFYQSETIVRGLNFDLGIQGHSDFTMRHKVRKKDETTKITTKTTVHDSLVFSWGITYSPGSNINATRDVFAATFKEFYQYNKYGIIPRDTVKFTTDEPGKIKLPGSMAAGFAISHYYKNRNNFYNYQFGADVEYSDWSTYRNFGNPDSVYKSMGIRLGGYYKPMNEGSYLNQIEYRLGVHYNVTPIQVRGSAVNEYGVAVGFGLPLVSKYNYTMINLGFEAGRMGSLANNLVADTYFKFSIGLNLVSYQWFLRYKYE
jgi:hypothetical protein